MPFWKKKIDKGGKKKAAEARGSPDSTAVHPHAADV